MVEPSLADIDGGALEVRASLFANIENGLRKNPGGLATIVMHQRQEHLAALVRDFSDDQPSPSHASNCLKWTYAQLHGAAMKFAAALAVQGIRPGMKIATIFSNRVEWPLTLWMTTILRLTLCSLDPGILNRPRREELGALLSALQPEIILVADEDGPHAIDEILSGLAASGFRESKIKIVLDSSTSQSSTGRWIPLESFISMASMHDVDEEELLQAARNDDPDRHALVIFTSGTTSGTPKGCPRDIRSGCHSLFSQIYGVHGFDETSRVLQSTANFRIIAFSITIFAWASGAAAIIPDPALGVKGSIAAIREHRISYMLFIPALLHAMVAQSEFRDLDVSSVTDVQLGGEITTRDVYNKAARSFPNAYICNGHGMSEGGGMFNWCFKDVSVPDIPYINDICPLGKVARGARVRIQDPENPHGKIMKRGEVGELVCSCDSIIKSYLGNVFPETFFTDSRTGLRWFRTGDLAVINPEGIVYIVGRAKDRIKRAGVPILPAALENCIENFVGVQTAVVACPHPVLGQEPLAIFRSWNGKSEEEIRERVISKFGKDYALGPIVSLKQLQMEQFPLNATGKVMKSALLQKWQEVEGS